MEFLLSLGLGLLDLAVADAVAAAVAAAVADAVAAAVADAVAAAVAAAIAVLLLGVDHGPVERAVQQELHQLEVVLQENKIEEM